MRLTPYDLGKRLPVSHPCRGFGGAAAWVGKDTRAGLCRDAGQHPRALNTWRLRHPDSELTDAEVIEVIVENKRRWRK